MPAKPTIGRACVTCSAAFFVFPSRLKSGGGKYCSIPCYAIAKRRALADRFWPKVRKGDDCWEWTAAHLPKGYGLIGAGGAGAGNLLTHRVAYAMASGGPIPDDLDVLHTCDNPPCVRNDGVSFYTLDGVARLCYGHLFLGTVQDNGIDMVEKGRDRQPWAKLNPAKVIAIRERFAAGGTTYSALGREHNVSCATIRDAILFKTWRRVG